MPTQAAQRDLQKLADLMGNTRVSFSLSRVDRAIDDCYTDMNSALNSTLISQLDRRVRKLEYPDVDFIAILLTALPIAWGIVSAVRAFQSAISGVVSQSVKTLANEAAGSATRAAAAVEKNRALWGSALEIAKEEYGQLISRIPQGKSCVEIVRKHFAVQAALIRKQMKSDAGRFWNTLTEIEKSALRVRKARLSSAPCPRLETLYDQILTELVKRGLIDRLVVHPSQKGGPNRIRKIWSPDRHLQLSSQLIWNRGLKEYLVFRKIFESRFITLGQTRKNGYPAIASFDIRRDVWKRSMRRSMVETLRKAEQTGKRPAPEPKRNYKRPGEI